MIDKAWKKLLKTTVRKYLPKKQFRVFIFGSRAMDNNRQYSDIDLGIQGKMPVEPWKMAKIADDLDKSMLPYKTDLVDFSISSPEFVKIAKTKLIYL
jgi:uncharacterized protein